MLTGQHCETGWMFSSQLQVYLQWFIQVVIFLPYIGKNTTYTLFLYTSAMTVLIHQLFLIMEYTDTRIRIPDKANAIKISELRLSRPFTVSGSLLWISSFIISLKYFPNFRDGLTRFRQVQKITLDHRRVWQY